jgi:hypothetical protein
MKVRWHWKRGGLGQAAAFLASLPLVALGVPVTFGIGWTVPVNSVYAGGTPFAFVKVDYKVKTVTSLKAAVVAIRDTTDEEIKVAGAAARDPLCVLTETNWTNSEWDPTTAPAVGDLIECVAIGFGAAVRVKTLSNVTPGQALITSATGSAANSGLITASSMFGRALTSMDGTKTTTSNDLLAVV